MWEHLHYLNMWIHDAGDTIEDGTVIYSFRASVVLKTRMEGSFIGTSNAFDLSTPD